MLCEGIKESAWTKSECYNSPNGTAGCHLKVSRRTASTKGREGLSLKPGNRFGPTTPSISLCALLWASGNRTIARRNTSKLADVCIAFIRCFSNMYCQQNRTVSDAAASNMSQRREIYSPQVLTAICNRRSVPDGKSYFWKVAVVLVFPDSITNHRTCIYFRCLGRLQKTISWETRINAHHLF